jgi:hypothetical protein
MELVFFLWVEERKGLDENSRISHSLPLQKEKNPFSDTMGLFEGGFFLPVKMEA